jgi:NitT/TauT family transport system substrate-binding protein
MKKRLKLLSIILLALIILTLSSGCSKQEEPKQLVKIRLNEVVCSIFYAPMCAAINQYFFAEEGIEIKLTTGQGADATHPKTQLMR